MRPDLYLTRHQPNATWDRCKECALKYPCPKAIDDLSHENYHDVLGYVNKCIEDYERAYGTMPASLRARYYSALNGDRTQLLPTVPAPRPGAAAEGRRTAPAPRERRRWPR